jgi:hypothetical protein
MPYFLMTKSILLSHLRLVFQEFPFFQFLHINTLSNFSFHPPTCHMNHPSHFLWFVLTNTLWEGVQIMKPLIMHLFPVPCYFLPLMSKYLLQHSDHKLSQPNEKYQHSHTYKTIDKILHLYISVFVLWNCKADGKISDSTVGNYSPTCVSTKGRF